MAQKFLSINAQGKDLEIEAIVASVGVADAGKIVALDNAGKLSLTFLPDGVGRDILTMPAFETLAADDFVNVFSDAGTLKARKADASQSARFAVGYVKSAVTSGANADVYFTGTISGSSLTVGAEYFLSATTAGKPATTVVTTAGQLCQKVGVATSTTQIYVNIERYRIRG